jgi:hypothetical protein
MIRVVHPGSRIRMLTFSHPGSRIQGSKRHPIPDPGSRNTEFIKVKRGTNLRTTAEECEAERLVDQERLHNCQVIEAVGVYATFQCEGGGTVYSEYSQRRLD